MAPGSILGTTSSSAADLLYNETCPARQSVSVDARFFSEQVIRRTDSTGTHALWTIGACVLVVAVSVVTRYQGIGFGLPHTETRPDEAHVVNLALRIAAGDPNPHFFIWPTLYIYLVSGLFLGVGALLETFRSQPLSQSDAFLISRSLSAAFGSASVLVVYWLGVRVGGRRVGLLAAAFLALALLHVRDSHFGTPDIAMTFAALLAVSILFGAADWTRLIAGALVAGFAVSIKYNACFVAVVAVWLELHGAWNGKQLWSRAFWRCVVFGAGMIVGFLIGTPYALLDHRAFLSAIRYILEHTEQGHAHGAEILVISEPAWRYASVVLPAAVGWPLFIAGVIGLIVVAQLRPPEGFACLLFPSLYFVAAAQGSLVFARYMIPIIPFLCLGAGYFIPMAVGTLRLRRAAGALTVILATLVVLPSALSVIRLNSLLKTPDTRLVAAQWIEQNVSSTRTVGQNGARYGRVQLTRFPESNLWAYDEKARGFLKNGIPVTGLPDFIVLQRSPLMLYSRVPGSLQRLLDEHYSAVISFHSGISAATQRDFDQSDAFFLPLSNLHVMRSPGPDLELYRRTSRTTPTTGETQE